MGLVVSPSEAGPHLAKCSAQGTLLGVSAGSPARAAPARAQGLPSQEGEEGNGFLKRVFLAWWLVFSHLEQQLDAGAVVGLCMARIWPHARAVLIPFGAGRALTLQGAASRRRCWEVSFTCTSEPDGD